MPQGPTVVLDITFVMLHLGNAHTCGLLGDGRSSCWGLNSFGRLADGSYVDSAEPSETVGVSLAKSMTVGGMHTCVVLENTVVQC